jgi:protein-disulfide isomerase
MPAVTRRLALALAAFALAAPALAAPAGINDEMAMGSPKAAVTVVEFASISCPHCAHFANTEFPAFRKAHVDTGKVRFVQKELLTQPSGFAAAGFLLARCAGRDKYFQVVAGLFRDQADIYKSGDAKAGLIKVGKEAGLDEAAVTACVTDQAKFDALGDRIDREAAAWKVEQVPSFFINGKPYKGEATAAGLSAAVEAALKTAPKRK